MLDPGFTWKAAFAVVLHRHLPVARRTGLAAPVEAKFVGPWNEDGEFVPDSRQQPVEGRRP